MAAGSSDSPLVRSAIGICLIAAISGLVYFDHWSGHGYGVIALAVALVTAGAWEYGRMAGVSAPVPARGLMLGSAAYVLIKGLAYELDPRLHLLQAPVAVVFAYALGFACLKGAPSLERFRGLSATALGFIYLPVFGGFALDVRFIAPETPTVGEWGFFYVVFIAKGTDICAYFAGKFLGKTKVVPSVSPGKTVAGFMGALTGGILITGLFAWGTPLGRFLPLPLVPGIGILLALVGISGDLIESFIKRSVAVKDSAKLLPNFGGVLDIIDSIVICAPPVYFLFRLLETLAL